MAVIRCVMVDECFNTLEKTQGSHPRGRKTVTRSLTQAGESEGLD